MTPPSLELAAERPRWDDYELTLLESEPLGPHRRLRLAAAGLAGRFAPGQFLNLSVPGHLLRRPLAVADQGSGWLELLVTPFGPGTRKLVGLTPGVRLRALGPLGNGFAEPAGDVALVSAGAGVAALLMLAERARAGGGSVYVFHGAPGAEDAELVAASYEARGFAVSYYSEDGSHGRRGLPTEGLRELLAAGTAVSVYSVGPYALMRAAARLAIEYGRPGYVSLDVHMACGVGACLSCAVMTRQGQKRACVDGPVFEAREVVW